MDAYMTTKRVKIALFSMVASPTYLAVWAVNGDGEREPEGYSRLSEWIEVDFPMLTEAEIQARKQREVEAARKRLNEQLAALDSGEGK
jgi:hypothetical protein